MSRSSARRGLIEPLPALAAVIVVGLALGLYADALATVEPGPSESGTAKATLQSVHHAVSDDGVAVPSRVPGTGDAGPAGYDVNVTRVAGGQQWTAGPLPRKERPPPADRHQSGSTGGPFGRDGSG